MTIVKHPRNSSYLLLIIIVLTTFISCSKKEKGKTKSPTKTHNNINQVFQP